MSRFESGCRRFTEMYPNWRRDLPRKQTGRKTGMGVQSLRSAPVGAKPRSTGSRAPLHLRYAPVAHQEEASGLSPVKGGFKSLREYIPLYQNGIWIRLRTGGLRVQIPPRVFTRSWPSGTGWRLRTVGFPKGTFRVRIPPCALLPNISLLSHTEGTVWPAVY